MEKIKIKDISIEEMSNELIQVKLEYTKNDVLFKIQVLIDSNGLVPLQTISEHDVLEVPLIQNLTNNFKNWKEIEKSTKKELFFEALKEFDIKSKLSLEDALEIYNNMTLEMILSS